MNNSILYRLDWWLVLLYLLLVTVGITNVYSATYNDTLNSIFDFSQPVGKQFLFFLVSVFLGIIVLSLNVKFFEHFANVSYFISILLLAGLFLFGKTVSGATSWYNLGGFSLQPSEIAKLFTGFAQAPQPTAAPKEYNS